jgi:hypothetical protein
LYTLCGSRGQQQPAEGSSKERQQLAGAGQACSQPQPHGAPCMALLDSGEQVVLDDLLHWVWLLGGCQRISAPGCITKLALRHWHT